MLPVLKNGARPLWSPNMFLCLSIVHFLKFKKHTNTMTADDARHIVLLWFEAQARGVDDHAANAYFQAVRLGFLNNNLYNATEDMREKIRMTTQLYDAIQDGDPLLVEQALMEGADPDGGFLPSMDIEDEEDPCDLAADAGEGVDGAPDETSSRGSGFFFIPLISACEFTVQTGDVVSAATDASALHLVNILLDHGALVNAASGWGRTALIAAAQYGCTATVRRLLDAGADPDCVDEDGDTALHLATCLDFDDDDTRRTVLQIVEALCNAGADVTAVNNDGYTPFHSACGLPFVDPEMHTTLLTMLLHAGGHAVVNTRANNGMTPLLLMGSEEETDNAAQALLLVDAGADVTVASPTGWTALHYCAEKIEEYASIELLEALVDRGADVNAVTDDGQTPLHILCANEPTMDMLDALMNRGADVHARNNAGHTPLHLAAAVHNAEIVEMLIDNGCDVHAVDHEGNTPLHGAARSQYTQSVDVLLEHGAEINARDAQGRTPLHIALERRAMECGSNPGYLVACGADVNARDNAGRTPLHVAALSEYPKLDAFESLLAAGAQVNAIDASGRTPLHELVILPGHEDTTGFHWANEPKKLLHARIQCIKALVKAKANEFAVDHAGQTPLDLAQKSHPALFDVLCDPFVL
jgi:ankyrin repeat protein